MKIHKQSLLPSSAKLIFPLLLMSTTSAFAAPTDDLYLKGMIGYGVELGVTYDPNGLTGSPFLGDKQAPWGTTFGVAVGKKAGSLRYEAEYLAFLGNEQAFGISVDANNATTVRISGKLKIRAFMGNVYYDFFADDSPGFSYHPYVGVGLGYARSTIEFKNTDINVNGTVDSNLFAYQAMLGLKMNFNERFSISPEVRYLGSSTLEDSNDNLQMITLMANVAYQF